MQRILIFFHWPKKDKEPVNKIPELHWLTQKFQRLVKVSVNKPSRGLLSVRNTAIPTSDSQSRILTFF